MKQTLALKLGQQLTMTPQLQQAIRLLQLSALDLQQEIQAELESNPLLEEVLEPEDGPQEEAPELAEEPSTGLEDNPETLLADELARPIGEDIPVDTSWDDTYPTINTPAPVDPSYDPLANQTSEESLADHLLWQLNLTPMAQADRDIAVILIDAIDPDGFLQADLGDICATFNHGQAAEDAVCPEDIEGILRKIQGFDPTGVGARNLSECLTLQLDVLSPDTPWLEEARTLLTEHLELLGSKDYKTLVRRTRLSEEELSSVLALIRSLNPRPGRAIAEEATDYIVPDVVVRRDEGRWLVELNSDATPPLRVNPVYENMIGKTRDASDKAYLRDQLTDAKWFIKSLQTRNDTLLRVATQIVEVQRGFFEYGPEAMKPLILADIAEAVDLHESTISRVTSRKYMATPRGVYELKYFFSSHVGTNTGGEVSSTAIRALIKKLTAEENPRKPLSDSKIAAILKDQNINVARRTVAKYRESLSIPPSNERKQLV